MNEPTAKRHKRLPALEQVLAAHPRPADAKFVGYGTAGFRGRYDAAMEHMFVRIGIMAYLRAVKLQSVTGVMVTASHNAEPDNGAKICESGGDMLAESWEEYAAELVNLATVEEIVAFLSRVANSEGIELMSGAEVYVAMDTRPSSPAATHLVVMGIEGCGGTVRHYGVMTTPQLHYFVRERNLPHPGAADAPRDNVEAYYKQLSDAYHQIVATSDGPARAGQPLVVDCSNGVGASALSALAPMLADVLPLELRNVGGADGPVNEECGADHVQRLRLFPRRVDTAADAGRRMCALDGDADRLVYFYVKDTVKENATFMSQTAFAECDTDGDGQLSKDEFAVWHREHSNRDPTDAEWKHFHEADKNGDGSISRLEAGAVPGLLDGDKIAALATAFIKEQLDVLGLTAVITVGVVQTAYANGAASAYVQDAKVPVAFVPTGVKHLHKAAHEYDIGVYFEANGHGTVLFGPKALAAVDALPASSDRPSFAAARSRLQGLTRLINQAVGDALSDMLMVEAILAVSRRSDRQWAAIYADRPSRMLMLRVADRGVVRPRWDETRLVAPQDLQDAIDTLVAAVPAPARAFARPSGTEDAVRVYAEGPTQAVADDLALAVLGAVHRLAGGVGGIQSKI